MASKKGEVKFNLVLNLTSSLSEPSYINAKLKWWVVLIAVVLTWRFNSLEKSRIAEVILKISLDNILRKQWRHKENINHLVFYFI